jgi:hypothetical protein
MGLHCPAKEAIGGVGRLPSLKLPLSPGSFRLWQVAAAPNPLWRPPGVVEQAGGQAAEPHLPR